jgi:predicted permease
MNSVLSDLQHAYRALRKSPLFVAIAVAALTLGIGSNVAIFSVVNAVLLKPVPFAEPDRLVTLMISANRVPLIPAASPAQFAQWQTLTDVFESMAAFTSGSVNYAGGGTSERLNASRVSAGFFHTLRVPMMLGRGFTAEEDRRGAAGVVVVSHELWSRNLASDPQIVGRSIELDGAPYTVIGVAGDLDLREYGSPRVWLPLQPDPNTTERAYVYQVFGRLAPGVALAQAQERLEATVPAFRERFPGVLGPRAGFSALPMQAASVGASARTTLLLLAGAVVCVLLIACANVANLLLVRATVRHREIAIRSALGASRARVVRLLLAESGLLSLAGGALGLVVGYLGMRALLAVNTADLPRLGEAGALAQLDWRVAGFSAAAALVTTLLFGLAPALVASRPRLADIVKSGGRASAGGWQSRMRSALVMAEVAFAVVLLIGAGLLIRASLVLSGVEPGFDTRNVLTVQTSLSGPNFAATASVDEAIRVGREHVRAIPGVVGVAASCCVPMQPGWGMPFDIVGRDEPGLYTGSNAVVFSSPGYFEVLGIPVLRGRSFTADDGPGAAPVVIINEALAKRHWPDADPLASQMVIGGGAANMQAYADEPARQIVGIVADVRAVGLASDPEPVMYVPHAQLPDALNALITSSLSTTWLVRTALASADIARTVEQELRAVTGVPVTNVRTMEQIVSSSVARQRMHTLSMSAFAAVALLLATIGIYGVVSYSAQQRAQELAIRSALGAKPRHLRAIILRQGIALVGGGICAGLIASYSLANLLASFLFGVTPRDGAVFATAAALLFLVAMAVVALVARRAGRITAPRYE